MNKQTVGAANELILTKYEPVIGLEVHCQLKTKSKLFCRCATTFGELPNQNTCPVCLGYPGVLPVLNKQALNFAVKFGLAVGSKINERSVFARKQYFYPDLPKGYQITQFDLPYCSGGKIKIDSDKEINLTRAHLEEDAGKNVHGETASFVDLNRAGIPLIEVVSEPEIGSAQDAAAYLKKLRSIVRYLEICDGNLEEGSFRCDANVSLRARGKTEFGTRCEIKNLNSFRNVERAITFEIARQADVLDAGGKIEQATLLFDPSSGKTKVMRTKEDAHDYRYFPDPDLGLVVVTTEEIDSIRTEIPELPEDKITRFTTDYDLNDYDSGLLVAERELAEYFEAVVAKVGEKVTPKIVANWVLSEFMREANENDWDLNNPPVSAESLGRLLFLIGDGTISGKIAKKVFDFLVKDGGDVDTIIQEKGLVQVSDAGEIDRVVVEVIDEFPDQVAEYRAGKQKVLGFFVGQIMKRSGGKLNPGIVNKALKKRLDA